MAQAQQCPQPGTIESVEVEQVVDGDTLVLDDGRKVRLVGINTPELARPARYAQESWQLEDQPLAKQARAALAELIESAAVQLVPSVSGKDRYDRTLAHIYADGQNLTQQLLNNGWGFALTVAPDVRYSDCYFAAEKVARSQNAGVWKAYPPVAATKYDEHGRGGFHLITGLVTSVFVSKHAVWIDLDDTVAAMIPRKRYIGFVEPAEAYEGRFVELRGWVIDRQKDRPLPSYKKRWMVSITHPSMLSIVQ